MIKMTTCISVLSKNLLNQPEILYLTYFAATASSADGEIYKNSRVLSEKRKLTLNENQISEDILRNSFRII